MQQREQEQISAALPVRLRPDKGNWIIVVLFGIIGLAPLALPFLGPGAMSATDRATMAFLGMVFLIPSLILGYWQARAVVIADEDSLRWRGLGGWRMAAWADVSDYYEKLMAQSKPSPIIVTGSGRLYFNSGLWTVPSQLRAVIQRQATQAKASSWGILGMRPEADWSRRFDYKSADNWFIIFVLPGLMIACFGFLLWPIVLSVPGILKTDASLGWGWAWASAGMILFGLLPTALFLGLALPISLATARRRGQSITLGQNGPTYEDKERRIEARWEDISDIFIGRGMGRAVSFVVVSKQGTFDFSPSIKDFAVLRRAFPQYATALPEAKWRATESDVLGDASSRWSSRCEEIGKRVYHYRTRTNRALLWFPTALSLMLAVSYWRLAPLGLVPANTSGMLLGFGGLTLWAWWRYWKASLETDEDGITQQTLFGTRHLAWDDIVDYWQSDKDDSLFGVVKGPKIRLWFWTGIADVEDLKAEIQRRARNSRRRTWDKDTTDA